MEAKRAGSVNIGICVVRGVNAPKDGDFMQERMLGVDQQIQRENRDQNGEGGRERKLVEQSDRVLLSANRCF